MLNDKRRKTKYQSFPQILKAKSKNSFMDVATCNIETYWVHCCWLYILTMRIQIWQSWLHVIIISRTSFRVNPHSIVCLNVKELPAWSRCHIWNLSDYNRIQTHNHLVHKWKLNHLAKLANVGNCGSRILICIGNMFRHWQWCVKLFVSLTWRFSLSLWLYSLLFFKFHSSILTSGLGKPKVDTFWLLRELKDVTETCVDPKPWNTSVQNHRSHGLVNHKNTNFQMNAPLDEPTPSPPPDYNFQIFNFQVCNNNNNNNKKNQ